MTCGLPSSPATVVVDHEVFSPCEVFQRVVGVWVSKASLQESFTYLWSQVPQNVRQRGVPGGGGSRRGDGVTGSA